MNRASMSAASESAEQIGIGNVFNKLTKQLGNPVEFELPERLNKWQAVPYVYIKRNIYVTKKPKRRHEDDGIFALAVHLQGLMLPVVGTATVGCYSPPAPQTVNVEMIVLINHFSSPRKKLKLVQTEKCGAGIVAVEDIKQGEFVIEYVGEVIDDKTCEDRLWEMKSTGETNFYLCEINRDMVIDATKKGNKSRYINHSCCPNTEMQKWSIDGETRIGIFATRNIKKGEHLTYDYQFVQFGADQDCHCGADSCRRKLGVKPNKKMPSSDAALKLVARQVAASSPKVKAILLGKNVYQNGSCYRDQRQCSFNCVGEVVKIPRPDHTRTFGIIKRFDNTTKKHLIMFADGSAEFIDMSKVDWEFCNFLL